MQLTTTTPGALSRMERTLTLPTAISCTTDASTNIVTMPIGLDFGTYRQCRPKHSTGGKIAIGLNDTITEPWRISTKKGTHPHCSHGNLQDFGDLFVAISLDANEKKDEHTTPPTYH